ncbi:hypothetical protein AVEN_257277-1 [Araneus ventricosus]|uniref:Uncharacterized protein n=1 Tax=Araneus ventricosus TaxID=182803 RepID=A0A4Y2HBN3_ARAVE|nr:hypothetical protein AVEN_257277-1 [Araneus ventricosus]
MEGFYSFLDEKIDCWYSVGELMEQTSGEKPTPTTVRQNRKEKYGDHIVFSTARTPQIFELSTIYHFLQPTPAGIFCRYIVEYAGFSVATLDGLNTFQTMGGIMCIKPFCALPLAGSSKKLKSVPTAEELGKLGVLKWLASENLKTSALQQIVVLFRTWTC